MNFGQLWRQGLGWRIRCEPHVSVMAKRVFARIKSDKSGEFEVSDSTDVCHMLEWFLVRFPLEMEKADAEHLSAQAAIFRADQEKCQSVLSAEYTPRRFDLMREPRLYQMRAAELFWAKRALLLADDLGLGKTCSGICTLREPAALPACVICPAHLSLQWAEEIRKFAPDLVTHVVKTRKTYPLPTKHGPVDVVILSYSKADEWAPILRARSNSIICDEVQELRHSGTNKYNACEQIANGCKYRLGLSATPIYNYGGEFWNIGNILYPQELGTRDEFATEWCDHAGEKMKIKDPEAFGAWLRERHLLLKRTRQEVGRELPGLQKIMQVIPCDEEQLVAGESRAAELARIMLDEMAAPVLRMQSASELDLLMRKWTGMGKSRHVAAFVEMLLEQGEPVVLFGWHRAVYEVWLEKLKKYNPVLYTGTESPTQKAAAKEKFIKGESKLFIISLRSGAGLDGLQSISRTVVFGELDWSPQVHDQCSGRVYRDGQEEPVTAYYLIADIGSDPIVAEMCGVKRAQSEGILGDTGGGVLVQTDHAAAVRRLAQSFMKSKT